MYCFLYLRDAGFMNDESMYDKQNLIVTFFQFQSIYFEKILIRIVTTFQFLKDTYMNF